jgi:transcriptional regulator with XRE-family HTH domain
MIGPAYRWPMDDLRVGAIVRAVRRRRGLRQADVARLAGVAQSTVSEIERGRLEPLCLRTIRNVCSALEMAAAGSCLAGSHFVRSWIRAMPRWWKRSAGWRRSAGDRAEHVQRLRGGSVDILAGGRGGLLIVESRPRTTRRTCYSPYCTGRLSCSGRSFGRATARRDPGRGVVMVEGGSAHALACHRATFAALPQRTVEVGAGSQPGPAGCAVLVCAPSAWRCCATGGGSRVEARKPGSGDTGAGERRSGARGV